MKKFMVSFDYEGFSFNAKVFITKQGNALIYSTQLMDEDKSHLFINKELIFAREKEGYKMLLFSAATKHTKQCFSLLNWHIKNTFVDTVDTLHINAFSMS